MPTPCRHCEESGISCKVDLRSGRCYECIRLRSRCDLSLTHGEWSCLKKEKARLEKEVEKNEEAKMEAMTKKTRLRKELAYLAGQKLEAAERELAAITRKDDKGYAAGAAEVSFPALSPPSPTDLQMSPQEWGLKDGLPKQFWSSPGPQTRMDDDSVFGELENA